MNAVHEDDSYLSDESSDNSLEELKELESRLYSIVHYNNLSETDPSDLPDGYKIDISSSNKITISLTNDIRPTSAKFGSLDGSETNDGSHAIDSNENIDLVSNSSEECNENQLLKNTKAPEEASASAVISSPVNESDDDVIIISPDPSPKLCKKRNSLNSNLFISNEMGSLDETDSSICVLNNSECLNTITQISNAVDSSDLITNITPAAGEKDVEEIIICSDDDQNNEIDNCASGKNKVRSKKKRKLEKQCPKKWTSSMVKFYCKISRKKLHFDSAKLIKEMRATVGREGWFINSRDLSGQLSKRNKARCRRCRQFDHDTKHCTEQIKPITCHMCGEIGHRENRCPHKKCLTCGKSNPVYVQMCSKCLKDVFKGNFHCTICNSNRHPENLCPDTWRSFHMTTKEGALVIPLSNYNSKKFCCNCGRSGHFDYECYEMSGSYYSKTKPFVDNYLAVAQMFSSQKENLTIDIRLNGKEGSVLSSEDGYEFLQNLSNTIEARLELTINSPYGSLTVNGSEIQCKAVIDKVHTFVMSKVPNSVSFHKHKRKSPSKRQRML